MHDVYLEVYPNNAVSYDTYRTIFIKADRIVVW